MGYYSSLIQRKFKDVVGKRYESVLRGYGEFLLSEEMMQVPEVNKILMPLDIFVKGVPGELYEILSAYDAEISLVYITDAQVYAIIQETLGTDVGQEYLQRKEVYGHELLDTVARELDSLGIPSHQRIFLGHKGEDIERIAEGYDLIALSKSFGAEKTEKYPVSPLVIRIMQHVAIATILY